MLVKRVLIVLPILIFVILLQSFFWVPTYDEQVKGNPHRLEQFITASIGDAKILNPILNADSASSAIVEQVFDGLIDRDEDLKFRGRLAERWDIYEEVFFYLNSNSPVKGKKISRPEGIKEILLDERNKIKKGGSPIEDTLVNIDRIEILPQQKGEKDFPTP
jgi:hypothetical protein